jgi:creatinine amidohydrolase
MELFPMQLAYMTWPEIAALDRTTPIVLPIAACEQHSHHLPVFTDSILLGEIVRRVQALPIGQRVAWTALQWLGNSHHHLDMPGTISSSPRRYLDMLHDLAESFLFHGFTRFVFLNGHGGNTTPSQQVAFELRQKHRNLDDLLVASLTYWDSQPGAPAGIDFVQQEMGHACEWETAMIMTLNPSWVRGELAAIDPVAPGTGAAPGYRGWTMRDRSVPGHIGYPAAATVEKGEALFAHFAKGVASFLDQVVQWNPPHWNLSNIKK